MFNIVFFSFYNSSSIPYIDPKHFTIENYKLNKKSDIYSIGILLWQISSGRRPFYADDVKYDIGLALAIQKGERENIIDGTPVEYSRIYTGNYCIFSSFNTFNRILLRILYI